MCHLNHQCVMVLKLKTWAASPHVKMFPTSQWTSLEIVSKLLWLAIKASFGVVRSTIVRLSHNFPQFAMVIQIKFSISLRDNVKTPVLSLTPELLISVSLLVLNLIL